MGRIVVGYDGPEAARHALEREAELGLGSVSEKVLHHAPCDVLVVR